jgi:hypothetical protein
MPAIVLCGCIRLLHGRCWDKQFFLTCLDQCEQVQLQEKELEEDQARPVSGFRFASLVQLGVLWRVLGGHAELWSAGMLPRFALIPLGTLHLRIQKHLTMRLRVIQGGAVAWRRFSSLYWLGLDVSA